MGMFIGGKIKLELAFTVRELYSWYAFCYWIMLLKAGFINCEHTPVLCPRCLRKQTNSVEPHFQEAQDEIVGVVTASLSCYSYHRRTSIHVCSERSSNQGHVHALALSNEELSRWNLLPSSPKSIVREDENAPQAFRRLRHIFNP